MEKKNEKEMLKLSEIDINKCFIDDANGFWDGFWERRNGLGAAPVYADPDSASETLRNYHQALWSRKYPLPQTVEEYLRNIEIQKEIVSKRNKRIKDFVYNVSQPKD